MNQARLYKQVDGNTAANLAPATDVLVLCPLTPERRQVNRLASSRVLLSGYKFKVIRAS